MRAAEELSENIAEIPWERIGGPEHDEWVGKSPGTCACGEEASEEELLARLDEVIEKNGENPGPHPRLAYCAGHIWLPSRSRAEAHRSRSEQTVQ